MDHKIDKGVSEMSKTTYRDNTLEKNYLHRLKSMIEEYQLVKLKKSTRFKTVKEFCEAFHTNRQTFLKYYNRYQMTHSEDSLLPHKRGPHWKTRRVDLKIEEKVIEQRKKGSSRYEVFIILKPELKEATPSPSTLYNIFKRYQMNRLTVPMKEVKRRIIKTKAGELGHVDCHYLSRALLPTPSTYRLVGVIDSCTGIAWVEVVPNVKSLVVMFATLKILNLLNARYKIKFDEILTDNGSEFGSGPHAKNKDSQPFEIMLSELGIKHRYTRPYRPQTNGKIERFWRTLEFDLLEDTTFDSIDHFKNELEQYLVYYNEYRPHQTLGGKTPSQFLNELALK